jgi:aromatic ring-opening dioxygenase LigB subunit
MEAAVLETGRQGQETWMIEDAELDHGAVVPLWFLAEAGWNGPTMVVSLCHPGQADVVTFGMALRQAAYDAGGRVAFLASGDMSHRLTPEAPCGFEPRAAAFDRWLVETVRAGDYQGLLQPDPALESLAGEDALDSILVATGATDFHSSGHEMLSYEGPFGVGYGVAILFDAAAAGDTPEASP